MRILLVLHTPWTRELGLPCCSVELAEAFRALGHKVDKFDLRDAFPRPGRLGRFFDEALFARRAVDFVRRHGRDYDVIQAEQGNLPVSKRELGFEGALVCRSDGLVHFHFEWLRAHRPRAFAAGGTPPGNALRWLAARLHGGLAAADRSLAAADAIVLLNGDELRFVSDRLGHGGKAVVLPNGLSEERFGALAGATWPAEARLAEQHIVFVGHLNERKGLTDLPEIVHRLPSARISLLGTGLAAARVLPLFSAADRARIRVVERYPWDALPGLLADATAGVLPSYVEGFPLGVLELLAAGVPTVAYDAPGARELLQPDALGPIGDAAALAGLLDGVLGLEPDEYAALAERSRAQAGRFRWRDIARDTLAVYESALRNR